MNVINVHKKLLRVLLFCGIFASLLYPLTDIIAGNMYKGYSFKEQTVSELFAIGAPTSHYVVILFTISSLLFIVFSLGIWLLSGSSHMVRTLSVMVFANSVNNLILWNFFPMHMRGTQPSFTDIMHGILAINPFILVTIVLGAVYFKNWFRYYSIATILILLITAIMAFSLAPLVFKNLPTPGLGIMERVSQYSHQLWHTVLAIVLLHGLSLEKINMQFDTIIFNERKTQQYMK